MKQINIEDRLIEFAATSLNIATNLKMTKGGLAIENQMVRSSTSSALNYGEMRSAESRKDFIHKLQIVLKELRETLIALKIIKSAKLHSDESIIQKAIIENDELISIFVKSLHTAKQKNRR